MAKNKVTNKQASREYILVPVVWLARLMELADKDGTTSQHLKGYLASADVIMSNGKRVDEEKYHSL